MIDYQFDATKAILRVHPTGPLSKNDFDRLAAAIDPHIEQTGDLAGLILEFTRFPDWENFAAAVRHFRFVRDHHRHIKKVAVVTDSPLGDLAEHLVAHFISAEVRHFANNETNRALNWIVGC
jgi:hypothetical protein